MKESPADLLLQLLAIPSVIGNEKAIADFVEARLRKSLQDVRRAGNGIVAFGPKRGRPRVALAGHLDTVAAAPGDPTATAPRTDAGRIFGLGASDMKCSIACDLLLLESLDWNSCPFDLAFVYYDKEEGPIVENGLRPLFDAVPELSQIQLAICGEPTDNAIQLGCLGTLHAKVAFLGRAAHSARPWQGDNAIHKSAPLLAYLAAAAPRDITIDGLLYREVISATTASGGRSRNVVPDRFEINVNARFSANTNPATIERTIRELAPGAEVTIIDLAPAAPPQRNNPLIDRLASSTRAPIEAKQAWTDVAQFHARGIPAVNFGPGEQSQAHQRNESISVTSLEKGLDLRRAYFTN